MNTILTIFWFFLPAGIANMSPVLFKWLPFLNYPLDANLKLNKKRIFGKNKTWRGLVVGILMAILIVFLQKILYPHTQAFSLIDYSTTNIFLLGFLQGFGALMGDAIESFFKRQMNIAPGKPWAPFDQTDWILGAALCTLFYTPLTFTQIIIALLLFGLLHPLINLLGFFLKIKKNKF